MKTHDVLIPVEGSQPVSGLLHHPSGAWAGFVLAHGAGAGMTHPFLSAVADGLGQRGIMCLRYQFPFMQQGSKRPDRPALAQRTVRAAVAAAASVAPTLPLIAGGKSFGGRMTSQAQAETPLANVMGLVFFGFPLHPPKQPSLGRSDHLHAVQMPMLFLQGTRDALADTALMRSVVQGLGPRATLHPLEGADHAFKVPARSGVSGADVMTDMLDTVAVWAERLKSNNPIPL